MKISLLTESQHLNGYCFPQNYEPYIDPIKHRDFTKILNFQKSEFSNIAGKWLWVQCAVSYYNRKYYFNELEESLDTEILYDNNNIIVKNDQPIGRFFGNYNSNVKSKLIVTIPNLSSSKIYFRCLYLFRDFIPSNFNYKYMDLSLIGNETLPALTFAMNFANYKLAGSGIDITYTGCNPKYKCSNNNVRVPLSSVNFQLSSNFVFLPLCDINKVEKYNSETNLCESIDDCDLSSLNALYCMDENTPFLCKKNYFLNINSDGSTECKNQCENNLRTPGSATNFGICNADCLSTEILQNCPHNLNDLQNYVTNFKCVNECSRIDYQCIEENKSALFYNSCNYPYNFKHEYPQTFWENYAPNGYIIELWFMLDNVICQWNDNNKKYYIFYTNVHQIYRYNLKYYYSFENNGAQELNEINQYEWNKILIITEKNSVTIYQNFNYNEKKTISITNYPLSMTLYFCSNPGTDASIICGPNIQYGSVYYNNFRIWNLNLATVETIQAFNRGTYSDIPNSLLVNYPLTIEYIDNNVLIDTIGIYNQNINAAIVTETLDMYHKDKLIIYNYSNKFDWGISHIGNYVESIDSETKVLIGKKCDDNCKRCYSNSANTCYECNDTFVLYGQKCVYSNNFYLKTPSTTLGEYSFVTSTATSDITKLTSFTFTFWIKFYGILKGVNTQNPIILSLSSSTYLAFNRVNDENSLLLYVNTIKAFEDLNFKNYIGKWIPILIADYISSGTNKIYPHMFTLIVDRIDIPFSDGFSIPESGIPISQINIGNEIIALFYDIRIYSKFYQGAYGKILSNKSSDLFIHLKLFGKNCVSEDEITSAVNVVCALDYSLYFNGSSQETCDEIDNNYIEIEYDDNNMESVKHCYDCFSDCDEFCYKYGEQTCSCDLTKGVYWLRRNENFQTYCEKIPYIDFSNINPISINNAPSTETYEYTLEFWIFIYSYNEETNNFKKIYVEWNYHNKIIIFNEGLLRVQCIPIYDSTNSVSDKFPDSNTQSISFYNWQHIKCGTDLLKGKYFLLNNQIDLKAKRENYPNYEEINNDARKAMYKFFKIYRSDDSYTNFGYIFIREIKLWQQYNFKYLDSRYYDFNYNDVELLKKTFPGLLWYYRNLYRDIGSKLYLIEELSKTEIKLIYKSDYVGYNIIDPKNSGKTSLLTLCGNTEIYVEENSNCEPKSSTPSCSTFADSNSNCLICPENKKYLYVNDGSCVENCPPHYFENDKILQCRECHETCYRCTDRFYNNCKECTGSLYYNYKDNTCIENCESVGLTKSLTRPNTCVIFDAEASLENVDTVTPIDVNTFNHIVATVIGATASGYTTLWKFNVEETNNINLELGYNDLLTESDTPFIGDLTLLDTPLNPSFFKIGHKYVFELEIIKENNGEKVSVSVSWTLTMNQSPQNGYIKVVPNIGLAQETTFIMTCYDFTDENTNVELLEYFFYYIEDQTSTIINLSTDWSTNNEVFSKLSVRFYQPPTTKLEIFCKVRDRYGAESITSTKVTIVNHIDDKENNNLTEILSNYDLNPDIEDLKYYSRSEFLKSVSLNPHRDVQPSLYYSTFEVSLDGSKILMNDPKCVDTYCNYNGDCGIIDVTIACNCKSSYIGNNCNILKTSYSKLAYYFQEMYGRVFNIIETRGLTIGDDILFNSIYNIFYAAQFFFQDDIFFTRFLVEFINYLKNNAVTYILQSSSFIDKLFDYIDFYFNYFYIKLNQLKLSNQISSGLPFRNYTLLVSQQTNYESAFKDYVNMLEDLTLFLINNGITNYEYESTHIHYYLFTITESFSDSEFYEQKEFSKNYKSYILFMDCLFSKKLSFNYYLNIIEYKQYPFSHDSTFYPNITSDFISIKILDYNGKEIIIKDCDSLNPIKLYFSFTSYNWLNYINEQKFLFDPSNYKLPNDPIFRDPIYINKSGAVLNDTVEQRIAKYSRSYNLSGIYYIPNEKSLFSTNGITFENFTSDSNYIIFHSNHLTSFTCMLTPNKMDFVIDGRFFYLKKYILFKWKDNYIKNPGFLFIGFIMFLYLFTCFVCYCRDNKYFVKIEQLDFLKKEIVKVHFPYNQKGDKEIEEIIPNFNIQEKNKKEIKQMFDNVNFETESDKNEKETENVFTEIGTNSKSQRKKKINKKLSLNKKKKKKSVEEEEEEEEISEEENSEEEESENKGRRSKNKIFSLKEKMKLNNKKYNFFVNSDKTQPNYISLKRFHNLENDNENLPEDFTNEKQERFRALEAYTNLKYPTSEFIKWNIFSRHILMGPLLNRSLFNQRWKKLTVLITQIYVNMMLISVILTAKEKITGKTFGKCISLSIITCITSNLFSYVIIIFFITSAYQRKRLFHLVMKGGQLVILKAYEKLKSHNKCSNSIGFILCFIIWLICIYITFTFVAVWKVQKSAWIITFISSEILDLIFFEFGIEIFIGILYHFRTKNNSIRNFGEWLNRLRCYRTLYP